jgi:hypothetical protein
MNSAILNSSAAREDLSVPPSETRKNLSSLIAGGLAGMTAKVIFNYLKFLYF